MFSTRMAAFRLRIRMFRKLEVALAALLMAAVVLLGAVTWFQREQLAEYRTKYSTASGDASAATTYASGIRTIYRDKETRDVDVEAVLEAHPVWRDEPLPDAAADLLRHSSGATRAVP